RVGADAARTAADASAKAARLEADKAKAVNQFLNEMLASANPSNASQASPAKGREITVFQVLNDAAAKLDAGSLRNQPEIDASVRSTLGQTYGALAEFKLAEPQFTKALELHRRLLGDSHPDVADDLNLLAVLRQFQGKLDECEKLNRQALAIRRKCFGDESAPVAETLNNLAATARDQG